MLRCIHAISGLKGGFVSRKGAIFFFVREEEKGEGLKKRLPSRHFDQAREARAGARRNLLLNAARLSRGFLRSASLRSK
jgi:hypothetical protein